MNINEIIINKETTIFEINIIEGRYKFKDEKEYSYYQECDDNPCIAKPADSSPIKISLPAKVDLDTSGVSKKYECNWKYSVWR